MKLTELSVKNSTSIMVLVVMMLIAGITAYFELPRETFPEVPIPVVLVHTLYVGVAPEDIETLVTNPLEKEFKGLDSLKEMSSTSAESSSIIVLEFQTEADIDTVLQDVRDKVSNVKSDLPDDVDDPMVIEINTSNFPVLIANVAGNMDAVRLKQIAEDLQDELEAKIPGLLEANINGEVVRQIRIEPNPDDLVAYGLSFNDIIGAVRSENVTLPSGKIDIGKTTYTVRVPGEFVRVSDIQNIVVKVKDGNPIYLRDVAKVRDAFEDVVSKSRVTTITHEDGGKVRYDTKSNISLSLVKRVGENMLEVVAQAKEIINDYEARNAGMDIILLFDASDNVSTQITDLQNNIITGLLLVMGVLFFFMGGFRNSLLVAICIPVSMFITFIVITALGFTLNTMVLFSLVLAVGLLIDNAIVVVENIYRHATQGKSNLRAAIEGTSEVAWPIIGGTATTVAAFFPLTLWPGTMGKFMGYLPKTVIVTLIASLLVALVVNPTFSSLFLKAKRGLVEEETAHPDNFLYRAYERTISLALRNRILVIALAILSLFGSLFILIKADTGVMFFPETTPEKFEVSVEMPEGTTLDQTKQVLAQLVEPIRDHSDIVESYVIDAGVKGGGGGPVSNRSQHYGRISVQLKDVAEQPFAPEPWLDELRAQYQKIPGAEVLVNVQSMGPPLKKPVNIEISGQNLHDSADYAQQIKDAIRPIPGLIDLTDDIELSKPEIKVRVDRERAALAGVSMRSVAEFIRIVMSGLETSKFHELDDEFDIVVILPEEYRTTLADIKRLKIANKDGHQIPITEIADISFGVGTGSIKHKEQSRVVTVSADVATGYFDGPILKEVQKRVAQLDAPLATTVKYAGKNQEQDEAQQFMGKAMGAALLLIFFILVTQFNSLLQPLIIMSTVLLSFIGVFLSIALTGMPFNVVMHGIAIISLAGIVVNNGIVLIDYINVLREKGYDRRFAVKTAGLVRMRPVLLTTATTLLSMLPMAIGFSINFIDLGIDFGGKNVQFWQPMSVALSAGLVVATMLTLIVVPVMYSLFDDIEIWVLSKFGVHVDKDNVSSSDDSSSGSGGGSSSGDSAIQDPTTTSISNAISIDEIFPKEYLDEISTPYVDSSDSVQFDDPDNADDKTNPRKKRSKKKSDLPDKIDLLLIGATLVGATFVSLPDGFAQDTSNTQPTRTQPTEGSNLPDFSKPQPKSLAVKSSADFSTPKDLEKKGVELRPEESIIADSTFFDLPSKRTLTYQQAIEIANASNLNVAKAQNQIVIAQSYIKQAYSMLLPSFNAGVSFTVNQDEVAVSMTGGVDVSKYGVEPPPPMVIVPKWTYNWSVSATLSANFRAISLLKQAYLQEDMAKKGVDVVREQIEIGVVQQFFALLTIQESIKIAKEQYDSALTTLNVTEKKRSLGTASDFEVTRAKLRVAQLKAFGEQNKSQFSQMRAGLANTLQTAEDFVVVSPDVATLQRSLDQLKQDALKSREVLKLHALQNEFADEQVSEMLFHYFPTLRATFRYGGARKVGLGASDPKWALVLSADWLIWDGGAREAEWDRLEAQRIGIQIDEKLARQNIDSDLNIAHADYKAKLAEMEVSQTNVNLATEALEQTQTAYRYGAASQLDVVSAEDSLRASKLAVVQTKLALELAIRKLNVLAGHE